MDGYAQHLLETRYLAPGEETWEDLIDRVAWHAAREDRAKFDNYKYTILNKLFVPSRMPYMGTDNPFVSSCFVLGPIEDSRTSIFSTLSDMAEVQAHGGGCIGGESVVITNHGPMEMKQLVEEQDPETEILSYNPDIGEMEFSEISQWHTVKTEPGRIYRINFAHGSHRSISSSIRASDWHPFFVFNGEKAVEVRADELKPGMAIIGSSEYRRGYDAWGWLLGYIAGDGCIDYNRLPKYPRVRIVDDNETNIKRAAETMGVEYSKSPDERYNVDMWHVTAESDTAGKIKKAFGGYKTAHDKRVPDELWNSSPERRFSFIVGHLDSDGWYSEEKKRFVAATVSEDLANDLVALAGSLGIRTKLRKREPRKLNESTIWHITYMPNKHLLEDVLSCSAKYNAKNASKWTMGTLELSHSWRDKLEKNGLKLGKPAWRGRINILGKQHSLVNWLQTGKATRGVAADIIQACGENNLAQAVRSAQIVYSVEQLPEEETLYDLTVPGNQTYVASPPDIGAFVVVHNTGYNFSQLRPEGDLIHTTRGKASGPVSFMKLYNAVTLTILRAGKKHGAQMGVLNVDHPDIEKFIDMKDGESDMVNFNVSVGITDDFMQAVLEDRNWELTFNGEIRKILPARMLFHKIAEHAHRNGEPGVIFLDTVNEHNKFPVEVNASNPCGEQMLPAQTSCNLGSVNLAEMVRVENGIPFIDYYRLANSVYTGIYFLNDSLNNAWWPLDKVRENTLRYRNIGLGVMGFADMLIKLTVPYDSDYAVTLSSILSKTIQLHAERAALQYAENHNLPINTTLTSIAPTGSISILAGCSSGIEPIFGVSFTKNTALGRTKVVSPLFKETAMKHGFYSRDLMEEAARIGRVQTLDIPNWAREIFKTATEIPYKRHIDIQAAWQENVDNSISKTVNLPNWATVKDVENAFMHAWETECKSTTVYRDGSRSVQAVDTGDKEGEDLSAIGLQVEYADELNGECVDCTL